MEIVSYTPPASWEDKGLDWDNPDPRNFNYLAAIIEAAKERYVNQKSLSADHYQDIFQASPGRPLSLSLLRKLREFIMYEVSESYLAIDSFAQTYDERPRNWRYYSFSNFAGPAFQIVENSSSLSDEALSAWLRAARVALMLLRFRRVSTEYQGVFSKNGFAYAENTDDHGGDATSLEAYESSKSRAVSAYTASGEWDDDSLYCCNYYALYEEYYAWQEIPNPYWAKFRIDSDAENVKVNIPSVAEFGIYARVLEWYDTHDETAATRFVGQLFFPDDVILEKKYCRLTVPVVDGIVDMKSVFDGPPIVPPYSEVPARPATSDHEYPRVSYGFQMDKMTAIVDYMQSFNFK